MFLLVLRVLKAGCHQQPQPGALLGISGSIFSSNPVVSTDTSTSSKSSGQSGLSTGAKVGIGLGVPAAVLILVLVIGCWFQRKKDRRNGHHRMNERWGDKSITSPVPGWTQYSPGTKRTVPPRGVVDNYYQPQYAFEASDYDERARHHDKFVLQDIPLPRQKPPPPAVRIDTRNLRRQRDRNDPSPQSLFD